MFVDHGITAPSRSAGTTRRLGVFVSHPIQYHVPLWRRLAAEPHLEVKLFYFSDQNLHGSVDPGFGVPVSWDTPLLDGYEYEFLRRGPLDRPKDMRIRSATSFLRAEALSHVLLVGYSYPFERQVAQAARALGIRVLMRAEFSDQGKGRSELKALARELYLRWFYSNVDAFGCIGHEAFRHLRARAVPEERLFSSPYCIDTEVFELQRQSFDRRQARATLGLAEHEFTLVFSGKLIPRKDPLFLLEAIRASEVAERTALIVIGDGELKQEVLERGRALLGSRLKFPGFVNQSLLGQYYAAADAFVLPSRFETWGMVVNEAMFFGLPALVSDQVGSSEDLVIPYKTGLTYRGGEVADLARHIRWLAEHPAECCQMGDDARAHVANYGPEAAADGLLRALKELR